MKDQALTLNPIFKDFYTQKLKEKCKDLNIYENIEDIINIEKEIEKESRSNKKFSENISAIICIIFLVVVFIFSSYMFDIFHFNFTDIMLLLLNLTWSFFLISLLLFFVFFNLYSFCHSIINIKRKPKGMSFTVFYSFFHFGIERYINKIAKKIIISPDIFYKLIQGTHYSENERNKMIEEYSKEKLEKEISLASFSEIVAKITIKYEYGYILSNFYSPMND